MPNQLINQTSPYLLQHANNPVNWHPWTEHALDMARTENKPILLSIGYAACHWCHVMERESFENDAIAKIMNKHFVCIKVDREERPDLDKIYQITHQMLTQRPGGWPLTIALTPDGHAPFFAGTYFPAEARYNRSGFGELLEKIAAHFAENSEKLSDYHLSFNNALEKLNPQLGTNKIPAPPTALNNATVHLTKQYDTEFGGFGNAPKFPHPTQLGLLLVVAGNPHSANIRSVKTNVEKAAEMVGNTLTQMARGGLFDHLGGGFFRYSVDRKWQIPHFEKMLYDNAQLLSLYCEGYHLFGDPQYADTASKTAQWVITEMQQPEGGYASTLDADSEGEEGKYYAWSETDLRAVLTEKEYSILENYFGLFGEPNFEGHWHFNLNPETKSCLSDDSESNPEREAALSTVKAKLLAIRSTRIRPALDHKMLTAWNGLMIKGMAKAGRILQQPEFIQSAQRSVDFIRNNMWQGMLSHKGRMLATCSQGKAHLNGYLDDYAFMLDGLLELLASSWRTPDLEFAIAICDAMLERFEDREKGGFFFTTHDHEKLLYRPKYGADDAIPSGNGAAILGLLKLGNLLGESKYLQSAETALSLFAEDLEHHPSVNSLMTTALQRLGDQHTTVIIRGDEDNLKWTQFCNTHYRPLTDIFMIDKDAKNLPPTLALRKAGKTTVAYVCKGNHCTPPIYSLDALKKQMDVLD